MPRDSNHDRGSELRPREAGGGTLPGPVSGRVAGRGEALSRTGTLPSALRLFGSILQREVDGKLLAEIRSRREELSSVLCGDPLAGVEEEDKAAAESLAVEYCRLFIGPGGHLPPVESVALGEGRFWGLSTEAVVGFYRSAGVRLDEDARLLPDHISVELDCLAVLEEGGRHDEAAAFAREHVLRWLPALVRHLEGNARLAFYPLWARGLQAILRDLYGREE